MCLMIMCVSVSPFCANHSAWETGRYLHLSALRPHCGQTDCLHSGGKEPEEDGCLWIIWYRNSNITKENINFLLTFYKEWYIAE